MMTVSSLAPGISRPFGLGMSLRNAVGPAIEVTLGAGQVWRMAGRARWRVILCMQGRIWVTQERDVQDYVMGPGEFFVVTQAGAVLVQALKEARFEVTPSLRTAPYAGDLLAFR